MAPTNQHPPILIVIDDDDDEDNGSSSQVHQQELFDNISRGKQKKHIKQGTSNVSIEKHPLNILKAQPVQMKRVHETAEAASTSNKGKAVSATVSDNPHNDETWFHVMKKSEFDQISSQHPLLMSKIKRKLKSSLVELFMDFRDATLSIVLAELLQERYPAEDRAPPPWWPTRKAKWWISSGFPMDKGDPPYGKPRTLVKLWKLAVLAAIIDSHCRQGICQTIRKASLVLEKMCSKERLILSLTLEHWNCPNAQQENSFKRLSTARSNWNRWLSASTSSQENILRSIKTKEPDIAESSLMATNKYMPANHRRNGMGLPFLKVKEEMVESDDSYSSLYPPTGFPYIGTGQMNQRLTQNDPPQLVGSSGIRSRKFAANNGLQQRQIASNGFNYAESCVNLENKGCRMAANEAGPILEETKEPRLVLTRVKWRNGVMLALPALPKEESTSCLQHGGNKLASPMPAGIHAVTGVQMDQSQSPFFQTNNLSRNPTVGNQEMQTVVHVDSTRSTAANQGSPLVSVQPAGLLNGRNLSFPQKIAETGTANQKYQPIAGPPRIQGQPSYEYNQVTAATENQGIQTLVNGSSTVTKMSWGLSKGISTAAGSAALMNQGTLIGPVSGSGTTEGSPMNQGQPSFSRVNSRLKVNPNLISSSTGPVYKYNQLAAATGNQESQTVLNVDSAAVNLGSLVASGPKGSPMNWGKSLFSPVNYGQHVNPNLMSSSTVSSVFEYNQWASSIGNQDLQSVVDSVAFMNRGVSNGNLVASEPVGSQMNHGQPSFSTVNYSLKVNPGPQMNQGQPSLIPAVNYSPQDNPNSMGSSSSNRGMHALVNGGNSCPSMNWGSNRGSLSASAEPSVGKINCAQQEPAVAKPDSLPLQEMELSEFSEFEEYFAGADKRNRGKEQVNNQVQHPSSTQKNSPIDEFGAYELYDWINEDVPPFWDYSWVNNLVDQ